MCHHYRSHKNKPPQYVDEFSVRSTLSQLDFLGKSFWPLGQVPLVRLDDRGDREMIAAQWGLLPFWWKPSGKSAKRSSFQRKCINARSEDIETKPTFREAFKRRRCLMPADEFFERGYYFHLPSHRPFAFAALWERWHDGQDSIESCTLLTTSPNELVKSVGHTRMPVLLTSEDQYALWLNPELTEREPLEQLFLPFEPAAMECYPAK